MQLFHINFAKLDRGSKSRVSIVSLDEFEGAQGGELFFLNIFAFSSHISCFCDQVLHMKYSSAVLQYSIRKF